MKFHGKKTKKTCLWEQCRRVFWTANPKRKYHTIHCGKMAYFERQREKLRKAEEIIRERAGL